MSCSFCVSSHLQFASLSLNLGHRAPIRLFGDVDNANVKYIKSYKIQGTGKRGAVEMRTNTDHVLHSDVLFKMGGQNTAPQPVELLLAALVGCTQATAVYVGRMMTPRLLIDKIEFDFGGFRDERGALELPIDQFPKIPARLKYVRGKINIHFKKGFTPTSEQLQSLKGQTEARCPIANMMHASGCNLDIEWIDKTSA